MTRKSTRPEGHTDPVGWVLLAEYHVRALARDLAESSTPIVEAASLDRVQQDNAHLFNNFTISRHCSSDDTSDRDSSADSSHNPAPHLQGFLPMVNALRNHQYRSPPEYVPNPQAVRHRRPKLKGKYDVCGQRGHTATSYEFLAMYLWVCHYYSPCAGVQSVYGLHLL